jgi:hypothetical protein
LHVTSDRLWFAGYEKYVGDGIEVPSMNIGDLVALLSAPTTPRVPGCGSRTS